MRGQPMPPNGGGVRVFPKASLLLTFRLFWTGVPVKMKWCLAGMARTLSLVLLVFLILCPSSRIM